MGKIIIHLGPPKCGSTTIQEFFTEHSHFCRDRVAFLGMHNDQIRALNSDSTPAKTIITIQKRIKAAISGHDILIISNEFFYTNHLAIKQVSSIAIQLCDSVDIIGYSRKVSDYIKSSYSQWFFRVANTIADYNDLMKQNKLNPELFFGIERHYIGNILSDFEKSMLSEHLSTYNWLDMYSNISSLVSHLDVTIKCGNLPMNETDDSLIVDFCNKAGIRLKTSHSEMYDNKANQQFSTVAIEGVNNGAIYDYQMPGPHEKNMVLATIADDCAFDIDSSLMQALAEYIDNYFWASNQIFCSKYQLDTSYFEPVNQPSKQQLLSIIESENAKRLTDPSDIINYYRQLSGKLMELSIKLKTTELEERKSTRLSRITKRMSRIFY